MNRDSRWVKKLFALILSGIIIISSIPVALATDNSTKDEAVEKVGDAATQDEAVKDNSDFPSVLLNKEARYYEDSDDKLYISSEGFVKLKVKLLPDAGLKDVIAESFKSKKGFSVIYTNLSTGEEKEYIGGTELKYADSVLTVVMDSMYGFNSGEYLLTIKFTLDDEDYILYSKDIVILSDPPVIDNILYDNSKEVTWTSGIVNVTFTVDGPILDTVTVNGNEVNELDGLYSFEADEAGEYIIEAVNKVGLSESKVTQNILVDKNEPEFYELAFYDENNNCVTDWTNKSLKAAVTFLDSKSGVDETSVTIDGEKPQSISEMDGGLTVFFTVDSRDNHIVKCSDKVGNEKTYVLEADKILIDKDAPKAEDITFNFLGAENTGDKILSFLSFGSYSNKDIKIKVDVENNGLSDIDVETIKLYNDDIELDRDGDYFVLPAPENDGEENKYNIYVEAGDKAGNISEKFFFNEKNIKAKLTGSDAELIMDISDRLYDVIVSKVAPDFDKNYGTDGTKFSFEPMHENDGVIYVSGNGEISAKIAEEVTGLKSVEVYIDGEKVSADFSDTDTSKKITNQTVKVQAGEFTDGLQDHTVEFRAVANSNVESVLPVTFKSYKKAPELDGEYGIELSNKLDGENQSWSKNDITVSFKFNNQTVPVENVTFFKTDDSSNVKPVVAKDGVYSFDAEVYGQYTIIAVDKLGNTAEFKTDIILIDKENPEVVANSVKPDVDWNVWTNRNVKVTFNVKDNPENGSGIAEVTVDGNSVSFDGGVCEFTAEKYGSHTIIVKDIAGNESSYVTKDVQIDRTSPVVEEVSFSSNANLNLREFGTYANSDPLVMTVKVTDPQISNGIFGSGIDKAKFMVMDGEDSADTVKLLKTDISANSMTFKYAVSTAEKVLDYSFVVFDRAGNNKRYWLTGENKSSEIAVTVSDSAKSYEVVNSIATPTIDIFAPKFTKDPQSDKDEKKTYYHGKGSFNATITDELCGIDSYETYFVKTADIKYDSTGTKITGGLTSPVEAKKGISDASKIKVINPVITTPEKVETGEYSAVIHATNLSGNDVYKTYPIVVDNTAPEITKFKIKAKNAKLNEKNGEVYGVYCNSPITLEMVYQDDTFSVGIDSTQFYNKDKKLGDGKSTSIVLEDNGQYLISGLVTDKFGQAQENDQDIKTVTVELNGEEIDLATSFEIVVNNDENALGISPAQYDFDYSNKGYSNEDYSNKDYIFSSKADGKGSITATVNNSLSGIASFTAAVYKDGSKIPKIESKASFDEAVYDVYNKATGLPPLTVDARNLDSGKYTIEYKAVDLGGVEHTESKTFYIDKNAPVYDSMSITATSETTVLKQILHVLSFGVYSNDNLMVTVKFHDDGPSAGVVTDKVELSCDGAKNIEAVSDGYIEVKDDEQKSYTYTKVFILTKTDKDYDKDKSFYNNLELSITDNYDNASSVSYDSENSKWHSVTVDVKNGTAATPDSVTIDGDYDVVATSIEPSVYDIALKGSNEYKENENVWFSDNPTLSFSADDAVSKIHSFTIKLNGNDVSSNAECTYTRVDGTSETGNKYIFTDFDTKKNDNDIAVKKIIVSLDTKLVSNYIKEGKNEIIVEVTGNNGVTTTTPKEFFVDTTQPDIQSFEFNNNKTSTQDRVEEDNARKNGVVNTDYGYFFKDKTEVTVHATDNIVPGVDNSGIKEIVLYTKSINESVLRPARVIGSNENSDEATFLIEANFKGQLYAYAVDHVNNNDSAKNFVPGVASDSYKVFTPDSVVLETEAQHVDNSGVSITPVSTPVNKDNKGYDLYGDYVTLTLEAYSNYAGIKSIEYIVSSPQDQSGENKSRDIIDTVDTNGNISGGWTVLATDQNLVTKARRNIVVANNSNDIKVEIIVTDRCGFSTKTDTTFSIDTTAPHIEVSFSPANGNKVTNGDYYKTDRIATITVTERNFNPSDFKLTITNTDGTIPSLSPGENWNTSYSVDAGNPDAITHIATVTFHADGDYNMESEYTDLAGHAADNNNKKENEFTIDQTAPKISVTYDVNNTNSYYNVTRTATITIEEHNFISDSGYLIITQDSRGADNTTSVTPPSVSSWSTSGDTSRATITFADDGMYSFTVDFKDKALNEATQVKESTFFIDKKIDTLEIVNVEDLKAYNGEVAPAINYFDQNFAEGTYSLKKVDFGSNPETVNDLLPNESAGGGFSKVVTYSDFDRIVENDGIYMLNAHIVDKAGNEKDENKLFSVNRFGSTFMINDPQTKELVEDKFYTNDAPDIVVTEINVNAVSDTSVQVNRDDSSRVLREGTDFKTVQSSGSSKSWYSYDYTIFKNNFNDEGSYVITVSSTDAFKKVISNRTAYADKEDESLNHARPIEFVVDKTAPIVTISGLEVEYYEESVREVTVYCDDANITSENMQVLFDGDNFTDYTISETSANIHLELELEADNGDIDREFDVIVYDKAGNRNNLDECGQVKGFRLSTSWIARLLHYNLPIVIAVGSVLAAGIVLAIVLIIRKRKKNNA